MFILKRLWRLIQDINSLFEFVRGCQKSLYNFVNFLNCLSNVDLQNLIRLGISLSNQSLPNVSDGALQNSKSVVSQSFKKHFNDKNSGPSNFHSFVKLHHLMQRSKDLIDDSAQAKLEILADFSKVA